MTNIGNKLVTSVTVEELCSYLESKGGLQQKKEPTFLAGVKELASFLHMSVSNAERKVCNHEFDYCLYRSERTLLFDKEKLLEGMKVNKNNKMFK